MKFPSRSKAAGEALYDCAKRVWFAYLEKSEHKTVYKIEDWMSLYESDFTLVSHQARTTMKRRKFNKPLLLPLFADIETVNQHLDEILVNAKYSEDVADYRHLASTMLAKCILFNRKRQGEASELQVSDYVNAVRCQPDAINRDVYDNLDEISQVVADYHFRIEFVGKRNQRGALMLTKPMQNAMTTLIAMRKLHVNPTVSCLFARPGKCVTPLRGLDCLFQAAVAAKAKTPELFKSTRLRKQLATMTQALELSTNYKEHLATYMGHRLQVHDTYYRQQLDVVDRSKVASILLKINSRRGGKELKNVNLEEVEVEGVHVDFDSGEEQDVTENGTTCRSYFFGPDMRFN